MAYYGQPIYNNPISQYNPVDRMNYNQMYSQPPMMQPYQQQFIPTNQNTAQNSNQSFPIRVRSVTSIKEAEAVIPELDCTLDVFVNVPTGEIYTKQLNVMNGSAIFNTYVLKPQQAAQEQQEQNSQQINMDSFVTKDEYNTVINLIDELNAKISEIENKSPNTTAVNDNKARGTK